MSPLELLRTFRLTEAQERAAFQLLAHQGERKAIAYARDCEEQNQQRRDREYQDYLDGFPLSEVNFRG